MKVVRITALWCMSCLVMKGRYDKLFKTFGIDDVMDLDFDLDDVSDYQPGHVLPIVIIYQDGLEIKRIVGEHSKKELHKLFTDITN